MTGGTGILGTACLAAARSAGSEVIGVSRHQGAAAGDAGWQHLDVRDLEGVRRTIKRVRPGLIIHTAYVQDDWRSTATGAAHVALAAAEVGARLVAVSSDAVFAGRPEPYPETAVPSPVTPYGAAKAAAETAVAAILPDAAVVRTSLIVGDDGRTPVERRVREAASGVGRHAFFTDDVRCPVHVADLAAALLEIGSAHRSGIHHVAGADALSRYDLAVLIAQRDGSDPRHVPAALRRESGVPGALEVRLDCAHTQGALTTRMRGAREFLT